MLVDPISGFANALVSHSKSSPFAQQNYDIAHGS